MSLTPLITASPVIQVHAYAAIAAFVLGAIQLAGVKGGLTHRQLGWVWSGLMMLVAGSSLFIHTIRLWGPFSPIHLLSLFVLVQVPRAVRAARQHRVPSHRSHMISMFVFALIVAGAFTFMPGRIMHDVVFGQ